MANIEDINMLAVLGTIGSIGFLIAQLRQSVNQEVRELIAEYNTRYLAIVARIPYEILVENKSFVDLESDQSINRQDIRRALYDYFLLCEEQLRLANERTFRNLHNPRRSIRIGLAIVFRDVKVWEKAMDEWVAGMEDNFERTAILEIFKLTTDSLRRNHRSKTFQFSSIFATEDERKNTTNDEPFSLIQEIINSKKLSTN
jgi:hypothetical protein